MNEEQDCKYQPGDHVMIAKDLGRYMSHFKADCAAIVLEAESPHHYALHIKGSGFHAWYGEHQLTLIETGCGEMLAAWEAAEEAESVLKSDLDWIFAHGDEVLRGASGDTVGALAQCFTDKDLWGPQGEGFTYYQNARSILTMAKPFLLAGDKAGYLDHVKGITV